MPFVTKKKLENLRNGILTGRKELRRQRYLAEIGAQARLHLTQLVDATNNAHSADVTQEVKLRMSRRAARHFLIKVRDVS